MAAVAFVVVGVLAIVVRNPWAILAGVPGAVVSVLLVPNALRRNMDQQIRRLLREGSNKGTLGRHELELTADDLIERTPFHELRTRLNGIERVISDGGYTFIYLSALSAHIIPHDAVAEGDADVFADALRARISA